MARRRKTQSGLGAIPLGAWRMVFLTGEDFLGELRPYGLVTIEDARCAAIEAWPTFRVAFMASLGGGFEQAGTWIEQARVADMRGDRR